MEKSLVVICHNFSIHWFVLFLTLTSCLLYFITIGNFTAETSSTTNFLSQTNRDHYVVALTNSTRDKNERIHKATKLATLPPNGLNITKNVSHISSYDHEGTNCLGKYIFVYDLPSEFNAKLVENCDSLSRWFDFCPYLSHMGFGPKVEDKSSKGVFWPNNKGWFKTNQFSLEVIFHERMKHYECLTNDSSRASAIFVPYYAGLDLGRFLWGFNTSMRDGLAKRLVGWLGQRPEWKRMFGRDHFFVGGRVAWDFRRDKDNNSEWGSKLMFLPESKNMTMLTIERGSWSNDFAIPYPTYFHPSSDNQVLEWQRRMRRAKRPYLFAFAGAPRPGLEGSIRGELIKQCLSSQKLCKLLGCNNARGTDCDEPASVMRAFERSVFCLQPSGDSFTRRSTFDSILAGCVPVFFNPASGYDQYLWHFPKNRTKYSIFIPESEVKDRKVSISETLLRVPKSEVLALREEVIEMIPRIVYADPKSGLEKFEDAFDIAIKNVPKRVQDLKVKIQE